VEHGRNYLAVQRARFSDRIAVEIASLPESLADLRVPKLILQPLLENAYNHGLKDTLRGGLVRLRFEDAGTAALIVVEDSGRSGTGSGPGSGPDSGSGSDAGMLDRTVAELSQELRNADLAGDGESSGLRNIHRRLHLRFGAFSGLRFDRSDLGGLKVCILIPLEEAPRV